MLTLTERIEKARAVALIPARELKFDPETVDAEAWDHIGDPLAEALIFEMRKQKRMSRNLYDVARSMEKEGNQIAIDFFKDVEHVPKWMDFEEMRSGAAMGYRNLFGFALGFHAVLPYTYGDNNVAKVMLGTGRLGDGGDHARRIWETATGFVGALEVDGMKPHGEEWKKWIRIRLMHTMVRLGILSSGTWDMSRGSPISALTTAGGVYAFGLYRARIMQAFGYASSEEVKSFVRMWQWVAKILGTPAEFIYEDLKDQEKIDVVIQKIISRTDDTSRRMTQVNFNGLVSLSHDFLPAKVHESFAYYLLSKKNPWLNQVDDTDLAEQLGVQQHAILKQAVPAIALGMRAVSQVKRIPMVKKATSWLGKKAINGLIEWELGDNKANYQTDMMDRKAKAKN